jgi:CheY-like chemotaxis protein
VNGNKENRRSQFREKLGQLRHDLKTPVGHIIGYSEMLEEEFEDTPWDEFTRDLGNIRMSGDRLVAQIEDFLGPDKSSLDQLNLSNVQFQLRIQLNHISGYCELLIELAEEEGRTELLTDLSRIAQASNNFASIVERKLVPAAFFEQSDQETDGVSQSVEPDIAKDQSLTLVSNNLGEGGDILVVDDNAVNLDLLSRRLGRQGYQTTVVNSGEQALEILQERSFELILLDLVMPGMSGLDVLKRLKSDSVLRAIPVIILSALDDMEKIVNCVLLGADDYVFKPFNPVLLKARISASLEKYRLRRQALPHLRIFISSPGDVIPERRIVRSVINQLNEEMSDLVILSPMFWEDEPLLASDTFQSQIHPARDADIYVGIFWSRLGSPLPDHIRRPDGTQYLSGSEYEFEDAMAGHDENGKPDILVYRKTSEPIIGLSDREAVMEKLNQMERLEGFTEKWFMSDDGKSFTGAFHGFDEETAFEDQFYNHLKKLVLNQLSVATT